MDTHFRKTMFIIGFYVLFFACNFPVEAQVAMNVDSLMNHLEIISDPERFGGRKSGTESGFASQSYIADRMESWGLEPLIGENLLIPYSQLATDEKRAKLRLENTPWGLIEYLTGDDFTLCTNSGSNTVRAEVTLVGYGVSEPEKGWDDYRGIDVEGKIVIITRGTPNTNQDWSDQYPRTYSFAEAVNHGAVAVLYHDRETPVYGAAIAEASYHPDIPVGYISDRVLRHLLIGTGYTQAAYERELRNGPFPLEIDKELYFSARCERLDDLAHNVAGVVPGTDSTLAHEAVLIGAHGDHAGVNAIGIPYPGADDNGSGTALIMELARYYVQHPQPRTLVFCVFGGEEQGLLGSRALAEILPDTFTYVNMVNFDMVGRGSGRTGIGGGDMLWEVWDPWYSELPDSMQSIVEGNRSWGGESSDHAPFRNRGIPAFTGYSRGHHDYYHTLDDRFYTIDREAMEGALNASSSWIEAVATFEEPLAERNLEARTIWHRGTPLVWQQGTTEPTIDADMIHRNRQHGWIGTVLEIPLEVDTTVQTHVILLDRWQDIIETDQKLEVGESVDGLTSVAYRRNSRIFFALEADQFTNADTTSWRTITQWGLHWAILRDFWAWVPDGGINPDKRHLLEEIISTETTIQLPLVNLERWLPIIEEAGEYAVLVGTTEEFDAIPDTMLAQIHETDAKIILLCDENSVSMIAVNMDAINQYRVHVQPESEEYEFVLQWINDLLQAGLERDEIINLIANHMNLW